MSLCKKNYKTLFVCVRDIAMPDTKDLGGLNATVAGWGAFHDLKCTTNEHGPSQNERCQFPFIERTKSKNGGDDDNSVTFNECTYAPNPGTKYPACHDFYLSMHNLRPFPKFPITLQTENETLVCHNNTHGRFGWCRTLENSNDIDADGGDDYTGERDNWGWCRPHCYNTNVRLRSKGKIKIQSSNAKPG